VNNRFALKFIYKEYGGPKARHILCNTQSRENAELFCIMVFFAPLRLCGKNIFATAVKNESP
jgi:hypothetical protein